MRLRNGGQEISLLLLLLLLLPWLPYLHSDALLLHAQHLPRLHLLGAVVAALRLRLRQLGGHRTATNHFIWGYRLSY